MEIKVRVIFFQYYMTSWVYISTVYLLGRLAECWDPEAGKRDVRHNKQIFLTTPIQP